MEKKKKEIKDQKKYNDPVSLYIGMSIFLADVEEELKSLVQVRD